MDGNKRIGLATTFMFLALNGRVLIASNDDMVDFAQELAGTQMKWRTVARWLRAHSVMAEDLVASSALAPEAALVTDRVRDLVEELVRHVEALVDELLG